MPGYRTMNNPSENLRNRPMFLESSWEKPATEKDPEDLKYDREVRKVDVSRKESMKKIESLLHEVGRTFQRLGTLVKMQEIMVDRIDKDLQSTEINVRKGKEELMKYYNDVRSNRGLCLRILAILMVFAVIYILFLL